MYFTHSPTRNWLCFAFVKQVNNNNKKPRTTSTTKTNAKGKAKANAHALASTQPKAGQSVAKPTGGSAAADDAADDDKDDDRDDEMIDGEDLDRRGRAVYEEDEARMEAMERARDEDRVRMLELLKTFTPAQMERYECYRRSNLSKPRLRKVFKAATGVTLNANGLIILAGISKMFVGEMVERARDIMRAKGLNEYEEIKPEHLRAAAREIDARDGLMRRRRTALFRRGYA